jgi:hypothetical protein
MTEDYADHNKTMLQQISDVAWLVHQGNQKLGILNKDVQEHYTYISGKELVNFTNDSEVIQHFGNLSLFKEQINEPTKKHEAYYIGGHKVDYPEPFAIESGHPAYNSDIPLYTKIENSDIYYAAGYYCIKFPKGWKHANSPKYTTLEKYGFEGPFKTLLEARQRIKILNKKKKIS